MSEDLKPTKDANVDSKADAIAIFLLITIAVVTAIYWVSGQ